MTEGQAAGSGPSPSNAAPRIVVKFKNDDEFTERYGYADGIQNSFDGPHSVMWRRIQEATGSARLVRLAPTDDLERLVELETRARENAARAGRPIPGRTTTYYAVEVDEGVATNALRRELQSSDWSDIVELVYEESAWAAPPQSPPPPVLPCANLTPYQGYLGRAPHGVDVKGVWRVGKAGGMGENISCVDVEGGWDLGHPDLPQVPTPAQMGINHNWPSTREHGLAVLGIVVGQHNGGCIDGIAPGSVPVPFSQWRTANTPANVAAAVSLGIQYLQLPGVILIEAQCADNTVLACTPAETDPGVFNQIQIASNLGHAVIEPSGNGFASGPGADLDTYTVTGRGLIFSAGAPDSGAIVVGSAWRSGKGNTPKWLRRTDSAYGQRVDCFAWGENITTLAPGSSRGPGSPYGSIAAFSGTSGASAIIAGVACVVMGVANAKARSLDGYELRDALRDKENGTVAANPPQGIGAMPSLPRVLRALSL